MIDPERLPWTVAVPIKRSTFTPLRPGDASLNVEVDLGRIGAFSNRIAPIPSEEVLYADLQLNPDVNANRRLGSGRAGVFAGRYLKGVGRTLLAGNWSRPDDLYHNSGLLLASSGARELLVSEYVARLGLERVIVPCEGLLVRPLPPGFEDHLRNMFGPRRVDHHGVDTHLQMISHKPVAFARLSNFVWWLAAFPQELEVASTIEAFFQLFDTATDPLTERATSPSADMIAERFARAALRGVSNFIAAWRAGITWGSVSNNFTADGRFLDLETPSVLGGPFLGCQLNALELDGKPPERISVGRSGHFFGLEVARYVSHLRAFAGHLLQRLRFLAEMRWVKPLETRFVTQFCERLRWHLRHTCPLSSIPTMSRRITDELCEVLELDRRERQIVGCMVRHAIEGQRFLEQDRGPAGFDAYKTCTFVRLDLDYVTPIEPGFRLELYVPEFLRDRPLPHRDASQVFHDSLRAIGRCTDVDACLTALGEATTRISRLRP